MGWVDVLEELGEPVRQRRLLLVTPQTFALLEGPACLLVRNIILYRYRYIYVCVCVCVYSPPPPAKNAHARSDDWVFIHSFAPAICLQQS